MSAQLFGKLIFRHLKKAVRVALLAPVLLVLLFEEWGWEPLARAFAALGKLPYWAALERLTTQEHLIMARMDQSDNTVAAHLGQLEDRFDRNAPVRL